MNYKSNILIVILFIIQLAPVKAQSDIALTGNLKTDSKILFDTYNKEHLPLITFQTENRKSPILAGLFSLAIPGTGEIYSGDYLKAAIFIAIEAAVITTAIIHDNKGDDQTEKFEKFANEKWSVVDYAEWLVQYEGADRDKIIISNDPNLPHWQRVNWAELNAVEIGSHKLPPYGNQQYYELIGKYHQYSPGWNDYSGGVNTADLSPNFKFYSLERGKANDFYSVASAAVIGIYINHFLSALDAVWTATQYNKSLAVKLRMEETFLTDRVELVPTLKLSFTF